MKVFCTILFTLHLFLSVKAQTPETLSIPPDARSSGMGDIGLATSPDAVSQHWNVAKYAYASAKGSIALSYTPWLRSITDDMNLFYLSGYGIIGQQAISASLRYFSMGEVNVANWEMSRNFLPNDVAFDIGYSRRFDEWFSLGLAFRYISTHYQTHDANLTLKAANAFAADFGAYFRLPAAKNEWTLGVAFTNIGTKIDIGDGLSVFLPMNLGIGTQYTWSLPKENILHIALDINKPLVPQNNENAGVVAGLFSSFGNSFNQITFSGGAEYSYQEKLFFRAGYYYNSPQAGGRSHATVGAGICFYNINLDCSYLIATGSANALKNTFRITLGYTFGQFDKSGKQSPDE